MAVTAKDIEEIAALLARPEVAALNDPQQGGTTCLNAADIAEVVVLLSGLSNRMKRTALSGVRCDGQNGEVGIARKFLPSGQWTYVDVGAGYPDSSSNTWRFYQEGWEGLLIEPLPTFWYGLLRHRPRDRLLPIALSNVKGFARLRACEACSSLRPDWSIAEHAEILVETDTLSAVLAGYADIRDRCQLCSLDVEGWERQVLEGVDWATFHPAIFIVEYRKFEADRLGDDLCQEWEPILLSHGYRRVGATSMNYLYSNQ